MEIPASVCGSCRCYNSDTAHFQFTRKLANTVAAFAKQATRQVHRKLFQDTANYQIEKLPWEWDLKELGGVVYAFMKAENHDQELLDVVGKEMLLRNEAAFDAKSCDHIAAAFSYCDDSKIGACTLELIFKSGTN